MTVDCSKIAGYLILEYYVTSTRALQHGVWIYARTCGQYSACFETIIT